MRRLNAERTDDMRTDSFNARIAFIAALVLAAALSRLLPHPPNFTPVVALALFAGARIAPRWLALAVPLLALFVTDLFLGLHVTLPAVYLAVVLAALLGGLLGPRGGALAVGGGALAAASLFFVVTNLAVWAVTGLYPLTGAGLAACFVAAIPFFGYTLAGTLFYALLLFGGLALAERGVPALAAAPRPAGAGPR